jgi:quercetin dioxygenase-like cupin family protein
LNPLNRLNEHTSPFDAFVYVYDRVAEVIISGKHHTIGNGKMIIMPTNEPQELKANERFKMMLVKVSKTGIVSMFLIPGK